MEKEDFDRYTKGPDSPAKSSMRFHKKSGLQSYNANTLIPKDYDEEMLL